MSLGGTFTLHNLLMNPLERYQKYSNAQSLVNSSVPKENGIALLYWLSSIIVLRPVLDFAPRLYFKRKHS